MLRSEIALLSLEEVTRYRESEGGMQIADAVDVGRFREPDYENLRSVDVRYEKKDEAKATVKGFRQWRMDVACRQERVSSHGSAEGT